jgi:radical SAM protein with 4Fe4S-binding SPASM domain
MRQNLKAIEPLIKLVFAKGVRHIRVLSLMPTGRAESQFKKIDLTSLEKQQLNSQLIRLHKNLGLDIKVGFCTSQDFKGLKILDEHDKCSAAENRIHIDTFGNVFPCTASSGRIMFSAGNLQIVENNLRSLWKESPLLQFFRAFHENPPMRCLGCAKHGTCMSGCRVKMSYLYGDITAADPKCKGPYKKTNQSQLQKGAL